MNNSVTNTLLASVFASTFLLSGCADKVEENTQATEQTLLTATGEITSLETSHVSPPSIKHMWSMKIEFMVPENQQVAVGDKLVVFNVQQLRDRLSEKNSQLLAEQKKLEQQQLRSKEEYERLKLDLASAEMAYSKEQDKSAILKVATSEIEKLKQQKELEIAKKKLQLAQQKYDNFERKKAIDLNVINSRLKRFASEVTEIEQGIERATVLANQAGIVMYSADHKGEKVAVGESVWVGRRVMSVANLEKLAVVAEFDEVDTTKIALGHEVKVVVDAYPEKPLVGLVAEVGQFYKRKSKNNGKKVFEVIIELQEQGDLLLRPGMQVKIEHFGLESMLAKESSGV